MIQIIPGGLANQLQLRLQFEETFRSEKDWLIVLSVRNGHEEVATGDLSWNYSPKIDAVYSYIELANGKGSFAPKPLESLVPFDRVCIRFAPWSANARSSSEVPPVRWVDYGASQMTLAGEDTSITTHVVGRTAIEIPQ